MQKLRVYVPTHVAEDWEAQRSVPQHRAGWMYAIDGFLSDPRVEIVYDYDPANPYATSDAPEGVGRIVFDDYVDRTFLWRREELENAGVIPYDNPASPPWAGVIHHTFDVGHAPNNALALFQTPAFQRSVLSGKCALLVCLTRALAEHVTAALQSLWADTSSAATTPPPPPPPPRVRVVEHPADFTAPMFDYGAFVRAPSPRLVQVGAWLRDAWAIFALDVSVPPPPNVVPTFRKFANPPQKRALRGPGMQDAYMDPAQFERTMDALSAEAADTVSATAPQSSSQVFDAKRIRDEYLRGVIASLRRQYASVAIIPALTSSEYDRLLATHAVFLRLVDASAVNTVLECLARATPLLVNRLPALEETLGRNYPGFYSSLSEAQEMAWDAGAYRRAHAYLLRLLRTGAKTRFSRENFVTSLFAELSARAPQS